MVTLWVVIPCEHSEARCAFVDLPLHFHALLAYLRGRPHRRLVVAPLPHSTRICGLAGICRFEYFEFAVLRFDVPRSLSKDVSLDGRLFRALLRCACIHACMWNR